MRLRQEKTRITEAVVAAGAVSQAPMLLPRVAEILVGQEATAATFARAAELATEGATPLPQAAWKTRVLSGSVLTALERAHT